MAFSSVEFLLYFLPVFLILYRFTPNKLKNITLMAGSFVFYAMGETRYLILLTVSVLVNYFVGIHLGTGGKRSSQSIEVQTERKIKRDRARRVLLIVAVTANVAVLLLFKINSEQLGLPLGISFYTFQILSYLIDVYRGDIHRETSPMKFCDYIIMFPQLISGPIVRYEEVEKELSDRSFSMETLQEGLQIFTLGLASKVLLADRIGVLWHDVQVTGFESISTGLAWLGAFAFSMEIYFDFYGYSLMAVGLGKMLGFTLPINFDTPYMAKSVREFYRRWHMTLGRWFSRYVYIPLGGSREGEVCTIRNLLIVWVLTALWHGSTANFLIWGMLLCLCIIVERQLARTGWGEYLTLLPRVYLWCVIPVSWMCFAITDVEELHIYLGRMFHVIEGINVPGGDWKSALDNYGVWLGVGFLACTPLVQMLYHKVKDMIVCKIILAAIFWICVWRLVVEGNNPFMYFQF